MGGGGTGGERVGVGKYIKRKLMGRGGGGGLHFCLILPVPFSQPRNIFVVVEQTSSQSVCL